MSTTFNYIRYFSDLHLEFDVKNGIQKWVPSELSTDKETILILAGDIYYGLMSIEWLKEFNNRFYSVIVVMGNHDYWHNNIHHLSEEYSEQLLLNHLDNVYLFSRKTAFLILEDYVFVGATLWTDMNKDPMAPLSVNQIMYPDIHYIYTKKYYDENYIQRKEHWQGIDWLEENQKDFKHIENVVQNFSDSKIVVITHHGCSYQSVSERFIGEYSNCYFVSDYSNFILDNPNIKYWIHGHVHSPCRYVIGETEILVNPRGYTNENSFFDEISLINLRK